MQYSTCDLGGSAKPFSVVFMHIYGTKTSKGASGGLNFQETLARGLLQKGFDVYAITNPADELGFSFLKDKRFVANYRRNNGDLKTLFLFDRRKLASELDRIIKLIPEKAIFVTVDPFPPDIYAALYLRVKRKKRVAVTMHHIPPNPLFHPFRRGGLIRSTTVWSMTILHLLLLKRFKIPVFLTNARMAEESGLKLDDILMEMPITLGKLINREPVGENFRACYIGRLHVNKGIKDLIDAWQLVVKEIPTAHLTLIGSDPSSGKYKELVEKKGLTKNITFTGYLTEKDKYSILDSCSIFPFASYEEGWSLAVMEAIDHGVLPILYNLAAYDYVCSDEVKVPPGDISRFAERIIYFFKHPEERKKITLKLQSCISKYTLDFVVNNWINQLKAHYDF